MPTYLDVVRLDAYVLGTGALANVTALVTDETADLDAQADFASRPDASPVYVQSRYGERDLVVRFTTPTYADRVAVWRMLDWPNPRTPRTLVAWVGDPAALVEASREVVATNVATRMRDVTVTFSSPDLAWRATADVATTTLALASVSGSTYVSNPGHVTVEPRITVAWTAQRTVGTHAATAGWRHRRTIGPITNLSGRTWEREAWCVDLGDTAALVTAGKALASGNDVRVWHEGKELPRTLVNWNSLRTFLWFHATTPPGGTLEPDIVYGNPSAATATTASLRTAFDADTYIAYDLEGVRRTATSGTASSVTDTAGTPYEVGRWKGGYVQIVSGAGNGQRRRIEDNTTATISVTRPWTSLPAAGSVFVVWMSGLAVDGGSSTAGSTTVLTDTAVVAGSWGIDAWKGARLFLIGGGAASGQSSTVVSSTANSVTVSPAFTISPGVGTSYYLERYGTHSYLVNRAVYETAHRGGWRINRYHSTPSSVWFGDQVPGGWQPMRYLDNDDDVSQTSYYDTGSGGGHNVNEWPILRARRQVKQDLAYTEEGQADGVALYDPRGFQAIYWDYRLLNENGVGKFLFAGLSAGGQNFEELVTNSATLASLTDQAAQWTDLEREDGAMVRLYMGVLPADGIEIPSDFSVTSDVEARWSTVLQTHIAHDSLGGLVDGLIPLGAETAVYHAAHVLRVGGGATPVPPYDIAALNRVTLTTGQSLRLNLDPAIDAPLAAVYAGEVVVAETPWAVTLQHVERPVWGDSGDDVTTLAADHLPVIAHDPATPTSGSTLYVSETAPGATTVAVVVRPRYLD